MKILFMVLVSLICLGCDSSSLSANDKNKRSDPKASPEGNANSTEDTHSVAVGLVSSVAPALNTPSVTASPSVAPTSTPSPAPIVVPKGQGNNSSSNNDKGKDKGSPSPSPSPTPKPTVVPTPSPTVTPVPTSTPTPVPTATPSPFPTIVPTPTPTPSPTPAPTIVPTPIPTPSPTPVPTVTPSPTPTPIPMPMVISLASGQDHVCALTNSGEVLCWGRNQNGQIGDGTFNDTSVPTSVITSGITSISAGQAHTCAVTIGGGLLCWGRNLEGQIGNGTYTNSSLPVTVFPNGSGIVSVSAGGYHTCVVTNIGSVLCFGRNSEGQFGISGNTISSSTPVEVPSASGIVSVAAGLYHTCALNNLGGVLCFGWNNDGELGNGTTGGTSSTPLEVLGLSSGVTAIATAYGHTCAIQNGNILCWGNGNEGELGDGIFSSSNVPVNVIGFTGIAVSISTGAVHTCALNSTGMVQCWGWNSNLLGDGTNTPSATPVEVNGLLGQSIAVGYDQSCALNMGMIQCWGSDRFGQLESSGTSSIPIRINF